MSQDKNHELWQKILLLSKETRVSCINKMLFGLTIQCAIGKFEIFRIHMLTRGDTQLGTWFKAMWENAKVLESKLEIIR